MSIKVRDQNSSDEPMKGEAESPENSDSDVLSEDHDPEVHHKVLADLYEKYRQIGRYGNHRSHYDRRRSANTSQTRVEERLDSETNFEKDTAWKPSPGMARSKTGSGPSKFDPRLLSDVLNFERRKRGWDRFISVGTIIGQWNDIVGDVVAEHCPVESFEEGKLIVQADSSAWAQQLQLLLPQVQRRIAEVVGEGIVEQVVVRPPRAPSWTRGRRNVPGRGPRDTYG